MQSLRDLVFLKETNVDISGNDLERFKRNHKCCENTSRGGVGPGCCVLHVE